MGKTWRNKPEEGFKIKRKNHSTKNRINNVDYDDIDSEDNLDSYDKLLDFNDKYDSEKI